MARGVNNSDRCPSGVSGFDNITSGGFVRNSVNALLGGPGAGKTIFLLQFLYSGAMDYGENGIYVSFENDSESVFQDAMEMGWDFQKLDEQNKCKFMRVSPLAGVPDLKRELTKAVSKYDIRRVCIDPISLFGAGEDNGGKLRILLYDLTSLLKRMNVTVLIANETPSSDAEEMSAATDMHSQYVRFLADAVVDLYSSGLGGASDRAIRVGKMRRTNHIRGPVPMQITNKGIQLLKQRGGGKKGLF